MRTHLMTIFAILTIFDNFLPFVVAIFDHFFLQFLTILANFWPIMTILTIFAKFYPDRKKQARKSSEDTHFTEYARFEKVWAG